MIDDVISEVPEPELPAPTQEDAHYACPICSRRFGLLGLVNKHLDTEHLGSPIPHDKGQNSNGRGVDMEDRLVTSPRGRRIKLDLLDENKGFSIRDNSHEDVPAKVTISRAHWKQPVPGVSTCQECQRMLTVKTGCVNCRKCGGLFCNKDTYYKVRLQNGVPTPEYSVDKHGVLSRSCYRCYQAKPDLAEGVGALIKDSTNQFLKLRLSKLNEKELNRIKLHRRFIRSVNLLAENLLESQGGLMAYFGAGDKYSKEVILSQQRQIVGEAWGAESTTHCTICFVPFNLLIRKHHCRLCGMVVCDDAYGDRSFCSINVPLNKLIDKLPNLNYSSQVKQNWERLLQGGPLFSLRCCKNCKNEILHDYRITLVTGPPQHDLLFKAYDDLLQSKENILRILERYVRLVDGSETEVARLRNKGMEVLRSHEVLVTSFRLKFFFRNDLGLHVREEYADIETLVKNIHNSLVALLQENLLTYKETSEKFKQKENERLAASATAQIEPSTPRLTKKQIRELREQLMVMNEQKFMIQKMMEDTKKQRKFDELAPLLENEKDLQRTIEHLEEQLGEFGFNG